MVNLFVKTHKSENLKYVQFIICEINKTIQNYQNLQYTETYILILNVSIVSNYNQIHSSKIYIQFLE